MQERRNSIASALEWRLSCTNPSRYSIGLLSLAIVSVLWLSSARDGIWMKSVDTESKTKGNLSEMWTMCHIFGMLTLPFVALSRTCDHGWIPVQWPSLSRVCVVGAVLMKLLGTWAWCFEVNATHLPGIPHLRSLSFRDRSPDVAASWLHQCPIHMHVDTTVSNSRSGSQRSRCVFLTCNQWSAFWFHEIFTSAAPCYIA